MITTDKEVGGNHYKRMVIQPIEFILKNNLGFCEGNVIKYITRFRHKNGKEDLLKAIHYIELLIESEYGNDDSEPRPIVSPNKDIIL